MKTQASCSGHLKPVLSQKKRRADMTLRLKIFRTILYILEMEVEPHLEDVTAGFGVSTIEFVLAVKISVRQIG